MGSGVSSSLTAPGTASKKYTADELKAAVDAAFGGGVASLPLVEVAARLEATLQLRQQSTLENAPTQSPPAAAAADTTTTQGVVVDWADLIATGPLSRNERAAAVRKVFDAFDDDDDKTITADEFVAVAMRHGATEDEALAAFDEMDNTRSGRLSLAKFDHFCSVQAIKLVADEFHKIDAATTVTCDRVLSKREVRVFFMNHGLSLQQCRELWHMMDANRNGTISFREWRDWARDVLAHEAVKLQAPDGKTKMRRSSSFS